MNSPLFHITIDKYLPLHGKMIEIRGTIKKIQSIIVNLKSVKQVNNVLRFICRSFSFYNSIFSIKVSGIKYCFLVGAGKTFLI